jgi:AcrR family transcriptional regulator
VSIRVARKRPDAYQHGDLRHALIQAGLKLLGEKGTEGLSLRAAAELAGVSHAAPYRHFRDKNALVAAIGEEGFRLLTRAMRDELQAAGQVDLPARLRAVAHGYVQFAVRHPGYFRTIFSAFNCFQGDEPEVVALRAAGQEAFAVLRDLVVEGVQTGELRPANPEHLALAGWSLVHGLSMLLIENQLGPVAEGPAKIREITEAVSLLLERGTRAP